MSVIEPSDLTYMGLLLQSVLDGAESLFPTGRFKRVEIVHGPPTWDCPDQLSVYLRRQFITSPMLQPSSSVVHRAVLPAAEITVTALGCMPNLKNGKPPTAAVLTAAAAEMANDAHALFRGLVRLAVAGTLVPNVAYDRFVFGEVTPVGPQGDTAGCEFSFTLTLQ